MVMEAVLEDADDGTMQCLDHPYKTHTPPGGICPLCLQEKLGKLVSSSFPVAIFPSASASPSPSFRSDSTLSSHTQTAAAHHHNPSRKPRIPFFASSSHKKEITPHDPVVFKRSKSTSTGGRIHFVDSYSEFNSPRKRGFWSFLKHHNSSKTSKEICYGGTPSTSSMRGFPRRSERIEEEIPAAVAEEEPSNLDSPAHARVSRSRSVGCGSRSFHGDFFDRISTGLGDCTLRRVESQREGGGGGKARAATPGRARGGGQDCIKERVKCGGIFGGFTINVSSSSSSSSSSYWVPSSSAEAAAASHGRSKSWAWALASPMRGFSKPPLKREGSDNNKNASTATPNLNAIPSLLTVGS